jgi:hypothetical protein
VGVAVYVKRRGNWEENGVKIYHTKKPLQLLDILRGGTSFDCGGMLGRGGRTCRKNHVTKKFQSWDANTYFSRLMARPLAAKVAKNVFK